MRRILIKSLMLPIAALIVAGCATIVSPSGGPKDETPPELLRSEPANGSTRFQGDRLLLTFSEFIDLKNIEKELLVSPPLGRDPDIKIKGKSLLIRIKDTLRSNTTYNFYLGNAIVDITESNPVANFNFAFSTGAVIDSMSLSGRMVDAFSMMPVKEAFVLLYTDFNDTIPKTQRPVYVSRTNESGDFSFRNIAYKPYRVIGLKDANNDFMYDMPNEQVAFISDTVYPVYIEKPKTDTSLSLKMPVEETPLQLLMFPEPDSTQRLTKTLVPADNRVTLIFRYPTKDLKFTLLDTASVVKWNYLEYTPNQDTVNLWLVPPVPDTLRMVVSANATVNDTVIIATHQKQRQTGRGAREIRKDLLNLKTNLESGRNLPWNTPLVITADNPVVTVNDSLPMLIRITRSDTIPVKVLISDSTRRRFRVDFGFTTGEEYSLRLPKATFTDLYSNTNDSVAYSIRPLSKDELGSLKIRLHSKNENIPFIVQLLGEKDAIMATKFIRSGETADFGFLKPGKYRIRAIFDLNNNRRWDTGVFLKNIQPEKVSIYQKIMEVRSNWEVEEDWVL